MFFRSRIGGLGPPRASQFKKSRTLHATQQSQSESMALPALCAHVLPAPALTYRPDSLSVRPKLTLTLGIETSSVSTRKIWQDPSCLYIIKQKSTYFAIFANFALLLSLLLPWHCTCLLLCGVFLRLRRLLVYTRFEWGKKLVASLAVGFFTISLACAGQTVVEEGKRKVKSKVAPVYPELARRLSLGGKV